ncbi:MAG: hypothetical protein LBU00_04110 [Treponema sp.]|jgi:predicted nucleic acid-binding protein|nr:hypothetical protein [Treponema sp.]
MNTNWLLDNSDTPIKYILTREKTYIEKFLENYEVRYWLSQLRPRWENTDLGEILRTKDALHIACSVYTDSDYLITTDKQLFNLKLDDIRIINPLTFINELEE